ncbi:MAG: NADH-quinone oxidoreductase subunit A [Chloroflexota bacterium]|nr:NADH-quinone oxidoreductase subunit A [Chloroflexota bacterium]MDE2687478.1 NADH-quinone oxidoreductase subunit A [Chloroflexota bacterium]
MAEEYAANWTAALIVAGVGAAAVVGMFLASYIVAPKRPSAVKDIPYECGIEPAPFRWSQIQIRYYVFAILFLIFDVEAVFLFPWAVVFLDTIPAVFYAMLIFIAILFFGVVYGWRKGVLHWR